MHFSTFNDGAGSILQSSFLEANHAVYNSFMLSFIVWYQFYLDFRVVLQVLLPDLPECIHMYPEGSPEDLCRP